jgi:hypothetical protein
MLRRHLLFQTRMHRLLVRVQLHSPLVPRPIPTLPLAILDRQDSEGAANKVKVTVVAVAKTVSLVSSFPKDSVDLEPIAALATISVLVATTLDSAVRPAGLEGAIVVASEEEDLGQTLPLGGLDAKFLQLTSER